MLGQMKVKFIDSYTRTPNRRRIRLDRPYAYLHPAMCFGIKRRTGKTLGNSIAYFMSQKRELQMLSLQPSGPTIQDDHPWCHDITAGRNQVGAAEM